MNHRNALVLVVTCLCSSCVVQTDRLEPLEGPPGAPGPAGEAGPPGEVDEDKFMRADQDTGTTGSVTVEGNLGIGTWTPATQLHLESTGSNAMLWVDRTDGARAKIAATETVVQFGSHSNHQLNLTVGNEAKMSITAAGRVGIGTSDPAYAFHVEQTGQNVALTATRTDGVTAYLNATDSFGNVGTVSNHSLRLTANSTAIMTVHPNGTLDMADGGGYDGAWNTASSRQQKDNIRELSVADAVHAVYQLRPVTFHYKTGAHEEHVGFIAEEVPQLVANQDRKSLSPMDVVAVLTKVVQDQRRQLENQQAAFEEAQADWSEALKAARRRVTELEVRMARLEASLRPWTAPRNPRNAPAPR